MIHYLKLSPSVDDHDESVVVIETACGASENDTKVDGATFDSFGELLAATLHGRSTICPACRALWATDLGSPEVKFR